MDPTPVSSSFEPTTEQASFRFTSPDSSTTRPQNYKQPFVEDDPEERLPPQYPPPRPTNTTDTDDDLVRICRICFCACPPPYDPSPEQGRLISPCVCRGSSRYVHSACLQSWRETSSEAFYVCPTCKYRYQLRRLSYASLLSSTTTTFIATSGILIAIVWALGFVSGPILSAYLDVDTPSNLELPVRPGGWAEHFLRGLASLGLLGFFKVIYIIGPGSWWSIRNSGVLGGRERVSRLSWLVIAVGVANFFVLLWKQVGGVVRRKMDKMAVEVMDIGEGGDGEVRNTERVPWGTCVTQGAAGLWANMSGLASRVMGNGDP